MVLIAIHCSGVIGAVVKAAGNEAVAEIAEELADVGMYLFELADNLGIDIVEAMEKKLEKNAKKYPVEKAKGRRTKYNRL